MRQKYGVLHLAGSELLFLHKNQGLSGGWGHKQGHLQPLQSPQGAQPESPVVWPLLPGPGWVLFYSLYNINRISMYTWARQPLGTQQRPCL